MAAKRTAACSLSPALFRLEISSAMCAIASSIGVIFRSGNSSTGNLTAWGRVGSIIAPQKLVVQGEFGAQVPEGAVGQGVAGLDHQRVHLGRFGGPAEGGEQFDG